MNQSSLLDVHDSHTYTLVTPNTHKHKQIEYLLLKKDSKEKKMFLSLRAKEILDTLIAEEETYHANPNTTAPLASWKPEYGRFMLEGTPFFPYEGSIKAMLQVEENMKKRLVCF